MLRTNKIYECFKNPGFFFCLFVCLFVLFVCLFVLYKYRTKQNGKNAAQFFYKHCQGRYVENFGEKY